MTLPDSPTSSAPLLVPAYPDGAQALGIGKTRMFALIASGEIASVKLGRKRMVEPAALAAYVEKLRGQADDAA